MPWRALSERRPYRLTEPFACLAPLGIMLAVCFLAVGGEEKTAVFFREIRASFPVVPTVFSWLSQYGNIPFYAIYAYIFCRSAARRQRNDLYFVLHYLAALAMLLLVVDIMKIWVGRPRPGVAGEYLLLTLNRAQHSFPSNHVTETVFSIMALALRFRNRPFSALCGLWVTGMGFARLCLGRHHPTDLLMSAALGCLGAYFVCWLSESCPARASVGNRRFGEKDSLSHIANKTL